MLGVHRETVKRTPLLLPAGFALLSGSLTIQRDLRQQRPAVALTLRSFLETLDRFRTRHRRRLPFLVPAVERRRPRLAAEDYAARHSIEHTLDRKAELRRLAPALPSAAHRYHQLLTFELEGLRELVSALHSVAGDRELEECVAEAALQMERLEIEIKWCNHLLETGAQTVPTHG
jgi:hypothetical protein